MAVGRSDALAKMAHAQWADLANSSRRKNIARLVSRFIAGVGGVDELVTIWVNAFSRSSDLKRVRCGEALFKLMGYLEEIARTERTNATKKLSQEHLDRELLEFQVQAVLEIPEKFLIGILKQRGLEIIRL